MIAAAELNRDQDLAAQMRRDGYTWRYIAAELELPSAALARRYAAASDRRAEERAHEGQTVLFDIPPQQEKCCGSHSGQQGRVVHF